MAPLSLVAFFLAVSASLVVHGQDISDPTGPDKFLEKFGYLPEETTHGAFHSPEARTEAVKEFQRMAHLPDTGLLDEPTRKMMIAPRCGVADQFPNRRSLDENGNPMGPQNYELPGLKWKKKKLTWKMHDFSPDLDVASQRYALWRGFKYWSDVSGLEFQETTGEADINIKFGRGDHGDGGGNDFDGPGMILAHAYFPESGDLHFDEDEHWTMRSEKGTNLRIVAAHEIGHALGLSHSTVWEALMAPWYAGYVPEDQFKLHVDDVDGIQYLYGRNTNPSSTDEKFPETPVETTAAPAAVTTKQPTQEGPNPCTTRFDAMFNAPDDKVYVLRGQYIFRLDDNGVMRGFPIKIRQLFPSAPYDVSGAVYSQRTGRVYLFKSRRIWRYTAAVLPSGRARFTLDRGFPVNKYRDRHFPDVEAALTDSSGKMLLISRNKVYEYNEYYLTASVRPENLSSKFPRIPSFLDAAIRHKNYMYFFKGDSYYKFAENHGLVAGPKPKAVPWMGCSGPQQPR